MLGPRFRFILSLVLGMGSIDLAWSDEPGQAPAPTQPPRRSFDLEVEDPALPFVPLHPRTAADRDRMEALRLYAAARGQEDRRNWSEAVKLFEQALQKAPGSIPILRRLSRLSLALGRVEPAVGYSRQVLDVEPGDTATLSMLVDYYLTRRGDPARAESLLIKTLSNPKLAKGSAGYVLIERDLGDLYVDFLQQPDQAADCYVRVMESLDERAANQISLVDQKRILKGDEAESYLKFGVTLLRAKRFDAAIRAFQRGLVYDPDNGQLPRFLAEALHKVGQESAALSTLEPFLKRQPTGREPYELLGVILSALKRDNEFLPRLEAAAKADPKNISLQFALAERYRAVGHPEQAEALLKTLLANQAEPQVYGALAGSLLKEAKYDELIRVLGEALIKPGGFEAVKNHIDELANDPALAAAALDAGLKLQSESPPRLTEPARKVLEFVGTRAKHTDKLIALDRLVLKQKPTRQSYLELADVLTKAGRYEESAKLLVELFDKLPDEKNSKLILFQAQSWLMAGQSYNALSAAKEALKLDPTDLAAQLMIGSALGRLGKNDEAIAHYKAMLEKSGNNEEIAKRAHAGLSVIYVNMEDYAKGEAELEILLQKNPDDPTVNNDLGYLYADQGKNLEKAESMIRKAVEDEPDNSSYLDSLGWVLFKRGKVKEAAEPLEKAIKDSSVDATIHDHLGDVYFKLQEYAKAKAAWQHAEAIAAKSNPPDKRLAEIRRKLTELGKLGPAPKAGTGDSP